MNEQNTTSGSTTETNKVVSLFDAKKPAQENVQAAKADSEVKPTELTFEETMRRNMENHQRMQKERLKANSSVLKSYRIKN